MTLSFTHYVSVSPYAAPGAQRLLVALAPATVTDRRAEVAYAHIVSGDQ